MNKSKRLVFVVAVSLAATCGMAAVLQSWHFVQPDGALRFRVLNSFGGAAVLDNETQLVWEQAPDLTATTMTNAVERCDNLVLGDRLGWKVPTTSQLTSLMDATQSPLLSADHPFTVDASVGFWSYSPNRSLDFTDARARVSFQTGEVVRPGNSPLRVWCVRSFE